MKKYDDFRKNAKVKYINKLKEIRYWEKVESKIKKFKEKGKEEFIMEFPHDVFSNNVKDDELKIEAIANYYGYKIVDESLLTNKTIYEFKKEDGINV